MSGWTPMARVGPEARRLSSIGRLALGRVADEGRDIPDYPRNLTPGRVIRSAR